MKIWGTDCLINPDLAGPYTTVTMSQVKFPFPAVPAGGYLRIRT